jgi:hypothetical protein
VTTVVEYDGFYGASRARMIALGQSAGANEILVEINQLQLLVDTAASTGNLDVVVSTTPMASSPLYFTAWNDPYNNDTGPDKLRRIAMNHVINYFTRLGYNVRRTRVGITNGFEWRIEW